MKFWPFCCVVMLFATIASGQSLNDDCSNASNLCPNLTYSGSNIGATTDVCAGCSDAATVTGNFCFEVDNTVWYSFVTNDLGGVASVSISGISCLTGAGNANGLQAVIIDVGTPCDESTYTQISSCESGSAADFVVQANTLSPNTTYYVLVDGVLGGLPNPAECDFSIQVSGQAVEPTATIVTQDQTCGLMDGEIDISNISGGQGPYQYSLDGSIYQGNGQFVGLVAGTYDITVLDANGCVFDMGGQQISTTGGPSGSTVAVINASCANADGSVIVNNTTGGTAPYSFSINGGAGQAGNQFNGLVAGTYEVIITDAQGCQEIIQNIVVGSTGGPSGATTVITSANCGGNDGGIVINVNGGTAPFTYTINGGGQQSSNSFSGLAPGTYNITVTDNNGCTYSIDNLIVDESVATEIPTITITANPDPICDGVPATITATSTNGGNNPTYVFYVNGVQMQSGNSDTYAGTFNAGDIIHCELISNDPCASVQIATSNTIDVWSNEEPTITITTTTTDVCNGDDVLIEADPNGCTNGVTLSWYINGNLVLSGPDSSITINTLVDGDVVTCEAQCEESCGNAVSSNGATFNVTTVDVDAGEDQIIVQGTSASLAGSGSGTPVWSPDNTLNDPNTYNPIASPSSTTTYTLTVSENGCTASDEVVVSVYLPIIIPNTITPNGDGYNDIWRILRAESYPGMDVNVYDRWGQRVYHSIGYTNQKPWDGTRSGSFLPAGTYYYVIDLKTGNKDLDLYNGTISIIY